MNFRKPASRRTGLKALFYGENGSGKSLAALDFPKNAVLDSESKIGVYERDPKIMEKIAGIADTANYYDTIKLAETVVKNPKDFQTFTIDSLTNIKNALEVSAMENEEERAKKKGGNIDDSTVSQRGWGKIKLNTMRLDGYIAQASAKGINVIAVAHKKDIMQDAGGKSVKVGEKPDLRANAEHNFDVIIRFYKEKDIASGKTKFMAEVEKDTTRTYEIGMKLENVGYDTFASYLGAQEKEETIETSYDKTIEGNIQEASKEQETHDQLVKEFKELYAELVKADATNKDKVAAILKNNGAEKFNSPENTEGLKKSISQMKELKSN